MKRFAAAVAAGIALSLTFGARAGAAQAPDGEALYRQNCRSCHGAKGVPNPRMVSVYAGLKAFDSTFLAARSVDSIVAVLKKGAGKDMKSFADRLNPEQITAVARFVKSLASGGAVQQP